MASGTNKLERLAQDATAARRVVEEFEVPDELQAVGSSTIKSIGLHVLTAGEEQQATKRARGGAAQLAYELAKASLAEINGDPVRLSDGSAERWWSDMHPQIRQLVLTAYADIHTVEDDVAKGFLKSRRSRV